MSNLSNLSDEQLLELAKAVQALEKKYKYNKALTYFTDTGRNSRDQYPCQMELMKAGKKHKIRALVGGNGSGKSVWNAYESMIHLTGKYPSWWEGYKFKGPIDGWICARETKALRDGIQEILFGGIGQDDIGTGMLAREDLTDDSGQIQTWAMAGTANCIGQFRIRHYTNGIFDGWSKCEFKTYAQGWKEFQGPTRQWISFDEEPDDEKIFAECIGRLRPKDGGEMGLFLATFTPTAGYTTTYLSFVPNGQFPAGGTHPDDPSKYTQKITWKDSPHLTDEWKNSALAQWKLTDPNNIEARTTGLAAMGSGRVYPINEQEVICSRQSIPAYWKKVYGMDPGAANFAGCWIAQDTNTGILYVYDEYKTSRHIMYLIHAEAFKTRGEWITGGIDPHEAVKPRDTGESVQSYFESQGLHLIEAKGDPDAIRMRIRAMFESGALRIMDNCTQLINEIRTYRYDPNDPNSIARGQDDHIIDAMMYAICVFERAAVSFVQFEEEEYNERRPKGHDDRDSGRNELTGY